MKTKSLKNLSRRPMLLAMLTLFCLLAGGLNLKAQQELTVYNGAVESSAVPMHVSWFDDYTKSQYVIPSSEIAAMNGGTISAIKYSLKDYNLPYTTESIVDIYLKEVNYTNISTFEDKSTATVVYHGTVSFTAAKVATITFDTPYSYNGGNLLIGCENTTDAGYKFIYFYGQTVTGASVAGHHDSDPDAISPTQQDYIPQTTFVFSNSNPNIVVSPTSKNLFPGNSTTLSATAHNVSGTPTISWTSSNTSVATVSPATGNTTTVTAVAEGTATITASMTINGTPYTATCTITVSDEVVIGSGTGTTSGNFLPTNLWYEYSLTQQIYTAEEIGTAGTITAISFYYNSSTSIGARNLDIYMSHTNNSTLSAWITEAAADKVYSGAYTFAVTEGWNTITLDTPFAYDGINNLLLTVYDHTGSYESSGLYFRTYSTNGNRARYIYDFDEEDVPAPTTGGSNGSALQYNNQIKLKMVQSNTPYLSLAPSTATIFTGFTTTLTATPHNVTETPTITWTSSNDNVATVNNGVVTGVAAGTATITATMTVNGTPYTAQSNITVEAPAYCTPAPTSIDGSGMHPVVFGTGSNTVNNTSYPTSSPYYGDYSSMIGAYDQGANASVEMSFYTHTGYTGYNYGVVIWVDWNKDYEFSDSEIVYTGTSTTPTSSTSPGTLTATFLIPVTQATGDYRMRIGAADSYFDDFIDDDATAAHNPCYTGSAYAVFHDYTLRVTAGKAYTVTCATTTNGTITANPLKADEGETITVTATPAAGYEVGSVTTSSPSTSVTNNGNGTYTFTMPASNVTVNATFTPISYTVTCNTPTGGTLSASPTTANVGATITVTATAATNNELVSLTWTPANGTPQSIDISTTPHTFTMPAANVTVNATYQALYNITYANDGNGTVGANPTTVAIEGQTVTVPYSPSAGFAFDHLTVTGQGGDVISTGNTFVMPAYNVTVTLYFVPGGSGHDGSVVTLDDRENHDWSYYSDGTSPIHKLNPADIKITYFGNGTGNMTNATENSDNPTSFSANATGVAVNMDAPEHTFVYYETLENAKDDGTGNYPYTTIANPFQVRPVFGGTKDAETMEMFEDEFDGSKAITYEKVTSSQSDWSGTYLLVYDYSTTVGYAFSGVNSSYHGTYTSVTKSNSGSTIASAGSAALLTLAPYSGNSSYYTIRINNGDYLYSAYDGFLTGSTATNGTYTSLEDGTQNYYCYFSVSYSGGSIRIYCPAWDGNYYIKFNTSDNYFIETTSSSHYSYPSLYKQNSDVCTPTWGTSDYGYISNFTVTCGGNTLLNSSSSGTKNSNTDYYDSRSITAAAGSTLSCTITPSGNSTYGFAVWVDFDNDGLESSDRVLYTTSYSASFSGQEFTIPANTPAGEYRLRILQDWSTKTPSDPCGSYNSGETEDYKLIVNNSSLSYTITATANPAAGGTVTGGGTFTSGTTCNLSATANSGYTFSSWMLNGVVVSTNPSYSFQVSGNANYVAVFNASGSTASQWRGFYAWRVKKLSSGLSITDGTNTYGEGSIISAEKDIYFVTSSEYGNEVEFEALWAQAYVTTTTSTSGLHQGVSYERNFMVLGGNPGTTTSTTQWPTSSSSESSNGGYLPMYNSNNNSYYSLTQQIYTPTQVGSAGNITQISFNVKTSQSSSQSLKIYLTSTSATTFPAPSSGDYTYRSISIDATNDLVYTGSVNFNSTGWKTITLDKSFYYDGTSNLLLTVVDDSKTTRSSVFYTYSSGGTRAISISYSSEPIDLVQYYYSTNTGYTYNNQIWFTKTNSSIDGITVPLTITSCNPNGTGGSSSVTLSESISCGADLKIENIKMNAVPTINGNGHNLAFGRGVTPTTTDGYCVTNVYGYATSSNTTADIAFKNRFESGRFNSVNLIYSSDGNTHALNGTADINAVFGSDYDRSTDANGLLYTYNVTLSYGLRATGSDSKYNMTVKSGINGANGSGSGDRFYMGFDLIPTLDAHVNGTFNRNVTILGGVFNGEFAGGINGYQGPTTDPHKDAIKIRIKGGTFTKRAYLGGTRLPAYGNRYMVATGGTFSTFITGGCYGRDENGGITYGSANIYFGGKASQTSTLGLFGSGYGSTDVYGTADENSYYVASSKVVVADEAQVAGSVYGGGNNGFALNSADVQILGGTVAGNVFGGSNKSKGTSVAVIVKDGTIEGSVYGGSNTNGTIYNVASVNVSGGTMTHVFGGGLGKNTNMNSGVEVFINDGSLEGNVYGGGQEGTVSGYTHVNVNGGTMGDVYGAGKGGSTEALITGQTYVDITGGSMTNVYGGGESGDVGAETATIIFTVEEGDGTGCQMLLDYDATAYGDVIPATGNFNCSGNDARYAQFEYKIPFNADGNCTTDNVVYKNTVTLNIPPDYYDWVITNPTPLEELYVVNTGNIAGRYNDYEFEANKTYHFVLTFDSSTQHYVVNLTITNSTAENSVASTVNIREGALISGNVFGGGKLGTTDGATVVNMYGGEVQGSVFAGAYGSPKTTIVLGNKTLNMVGGKVDGNIYGGSRNSNDSKNSYVNFSGGTVGKNVYGGGFYGNISGNTYVKIGKNAVEHSNNGDNTSIAGSTTVVTGTSELSFVPLYTFYCDYGSKGEFIIPASYFTNAGIASGTAFTSMTLTQSSPGAWVANNFKVKLLNTSSNAYASAGFVGDGGTLVYSNTSFASNADAEITITFSLPFTYTGGGLVVQLLCESGGTYKSSYWAGVETETNQGYYAFNYSGESGYANGKTLQKFLPAVAFGYEGAGSSTNTGINGGTNTDNIAVSTPDKITIGESVFAGSDWGEFTAGSTFMEPNITGVSNIFIDGTGYADGNIKIGNSVYGSGTSGDAGAVAHDIVIRNYGNLSGSTASQKLYTIQRAGKVVLENSHIEFIGKGDLASPTTTKMYSLLNIDDELIVTNGSSLVLHASAEQMHAMGSYLCTDAYSHPFDTTAVSYSGLGSCDNKIFFKDGCFININYDASPNPLYGQIRGFFHATAGTGHSGFAFARPKVHNNSGDDAYSGWNGHETLPLNTGDGGFVSYDATENTFNAIGGTVTEGGVQMPYKHHPTNRNDHQYYRVWTTGEGTIDDEVVITAFADGTDNSIHTATATAVLPRISSNDACGQQSYYRITNIEWSDVAQFVNAGIYDATTPYYGHISNSGGTLTLSYQQTAAHCSTEIAEINANPNYTFGLTIIPGAGMTLVDHNNQTVPAMVISEDGEEYYSSNPDHAVQMKPDANDQAKPQITFMLTYSNGILSTQAFSPVIFTIEEVDCSGNVLMTLEEYVKIETRTEIQDMESTVYARMYGTGPAHDSTTVKVVLPTWDLTDGTEYSVLSIEAIDNIPMVTGATRRANTYFNSSTGTTTDFGMTYKPAKESDNTLGWYEPENLLRCFDNQTVALPAELGKADGRDQVAIDFTVHYNGQAHHETAEDELAKQVYHVTMTNYAGSTKSFNITIHIKRRGQAQNWYIASSGSNANNGQYPDKPKRSVKALMNGTPSYTAGDRIFIVDTISINTPTEWDGYEYGGINIYRYPGGHYLSSGNEDITSGTPTPPQVGTYKGAMIVMNSTLVADSIFIDGIYGCNDGVINPHAGVEVTADGPVFVVNSGAKLTFRNGTIKNNRVAASAKADENKAGGVVMSGEMTVDGLVTISDNYLGTAKSNVYLTEADSKIAIETAMTETSVIGVTKTAMPEGKSLTPIAYSPEANSTMVATTYGYETFVPDASGTFTYYNAEATDDPNNYTIYFIVTWVSAVNSKPETFIEATPIQITCKEDLAWFISYVNGYNNSAKHAGASAIVTKDLDMKQYIWVPIGDAETAFAGSFDGGMYTIDNLHCNETDGIANQFNYIGMFGQTNGATVQNTFVVDADFASSKAGSYMGGLIGKATNGTVEFCEAAGTLTALADLTSMGGVVGEASGTAMKAIMSYTDMDGNGNSITNVGGVVGTGGTLQTALADNTFTDIANPKAIGNLAVNDAYTLSTTPTTLGSSVSAHGYAPSAYTGSDATGKFSDSDYSYGVDNNTVGGTTSTAGTPLVDLLNAGVASNYKWIRAAGSDINGGYPIIVKVVAEDSLAAVKPGLKAVRFGGINNMIATYADSTNAQIYMYNNGEITKPITATNKGKLYIDEHVALTQTASEVNAFVGITLDNSAGNGEQHRDWHMFSPSISNAATGINWKATQSIMEFDDDNLLIFGSEPNAGDYWFTNDVNSYFPTGINSGLAFDFYAFSEPDYHWINYKRNSDNHWHEDEPHTQITYTNETTLKQGEGYMVALGDNATKNNNLMQAFGTLTNANVEIDVTASGEHLKGYNLLGNPFQGYLDFAEFASANDALWASSGTEVIGKHSCLIYDADSARFLELLVDANSQSFSQGAAQSNNPYINMHQGFFIVKNGTATKAVFNNETMRVTNQTTHFRGEAPHYPLVNLFCTDSDGKQEVSVIEVERPLMAGALKMKGMLNGKCNMYIHWDGEDFGSMFLDHTPDYVPVWFDAAEDGVFTMTWSTANAAFGYMHLIDNMTGADIDCLVDDSYVFSATTTDMSARFRLVFKPLGVPETPTEQGENFAFINGEELIVNGEGELSFVDLNGHVLARQYVTGQQTRLAIPKVAVGMYMLTLTGSDGVKVQKIVIRK